MQFVEPYLASDDTKKAAYENEIQASRLSFNAAHRFQVASIYKF